MSFLCKFMSNPTKAEHDAVDHVLRYLAGKPNMGLKYARVDDRDYVLKAYSDSDHCSDRSRRSQTGHMMFIGPHLVGFRSTRQPTVSLSSSESEYVAASYASREVKYFRGFMEEIGLLDRRPTRLHIDNKSAVSWLKHSPIHIEARKHISIRRRFTEEMVENKEIELTGSFEWVATTQNPADFLTKPLAVKAFVTWRDKLMVTVDV